MIDVDRILEARQAIDPIFLSSPQYLARALEIEPASRLLMKVETLNPIGSFKGRGASWWLHHQGGARRVVCASAGNFGQGLAYAAAGRLSVDVFAAETANPSKLAAMKRLGARVHLHGADFDEAKARAAEYASEQGHPYVEDGLQDEIAEGAGTIAAELCEAPEPIDVIYVPVGNGALVNGVGSYFKQRSAATRVVGVCADGAPSMERSWRRGAATETTGVNTIADGVAARVPIQRALDHMADALDDMMLVDDSQIVDAMRLLFERENLVAEPAGAVSLAAAVADPQRRKGQTAAVIVTGGNIDPSRRAEWLATGD